jgi:CheY-like chemotaxis protein
MNAFPELVLLDLKIPKPDGFEVLSWIREQPHLKRMVVVVYTTSNLIEDINRAYDLGANSFLVKPIEREVLTISRRTHSAIGWYLNRRGDCGPRK